MGIGWDKFGRMCRTAPNSAEQRRTAAGNPNLVIGTSPERGGEREPRDIPHLASHSGSHCPDAKGDPLGSLFRQGCVCGTSHVCQSYSVQYL